jgi:hypothetical protein
MMEITDYGGRQKCGGGGGRAGYRGKEHVLGRRNDRDEMVVEFEKKTKQVGTKIWFKIHSRRRQM